MRSHISLVLVLGLSSIIAMAACSGVQSSAAQPAAAPDTVSPYLPPRAATILPGSSGSPRPTSGVGGSSPPFIEMVDNAFWPDVLRVRPGTTVTWQHFGNVPHDTRSVDDLWYSRNMMQGSKFAWTFNRPGEFRYFCTVHVEMTGMIIVEP